MRAPAKVSWSQTIRKLYNKLYGHLQTNVPDFDVEFWILFDPRSIASSILSKSSIIGMDIIMQDISEIIAWCVEAGSNFQYLVDILREPSHGTVIQWLIMVYSLVSKATKAESITLSRVCVNFPDLTYQYLTEASDTLITFSKGNFIY